MDNKLHKILPIYFLVAGLAALVALGYLFSIPGNEGRLNILGVSARYFLVAFTALALLLAAGISITLAYFSWCKPSKVLHRIESLLNKEAWWWGLFLITALIFLALVWANVSPSQLPVRPVIFIRIQPGLVWVMLVAVLTIFYLTKLFPNRVRYLSVELCAFTINVVIVRAVQTFLFPLESYWLWIAASLFLYALAETILVQSGRTKNFFSALDQEKVELRDALLLIAGPAILALILAVSGRGYIFFLLPVLWFTCGIQAFLANGIAGIWERIWLPEKKPSYLRSLLWFVSAVLVLWIYYLALLPMNTYTRYYPGLLPLSIYPHDNPLLQGDPTTRGIWYTIPTDKSDLYPLGYARLEDSVGGDDLGNPFFAVLGSTMGFMPPCSSPLLNTANAVPGSGMNSIPPHFISSGDILCPEWGGALSQFYWRIGMLGVLLISIVFGVVILRDPVAFFVVALVLLRAWTTWPSTRPGQVESVLFGMPFIMLLPYIIRHSRTSSILAWSLICGIVAGVAGFVRSPSGIALLVAGGLAIVVLAGIKKKRLLLATCAFLALLAGNQTMPTILNGLFWYRDTRLQIAAPRFSMISHVGTGWNVLGGIGGVYTPNGILYPNALDMTHWDAIIMINIYNENPLVLFALDGQSAISSTGNKLFVNYVLQHPAQFANITSQKAYQAWDMLIEIPTDWLQVLLILAILGSMGLILRRTLGLWISPVLDNDTGDVAGETLILCFTLAAILSIPIVLVDPRYYQVIYPPAAVLFISTQIALYNGVFHPLARWIT